MDHQNFIAASLAEAISSGVSWSPDFHRRFLDSAAAGNVSQSSARFFSKADLSHLMQVNKDQAGAASKADRMGKTRISAKALREVLMCCEENEARQSCEPKKEGDAYEISNVSPLSKTAQWRELHDTAIVARFGVKIEHAYIDGHLDLWGFAFARPLTFFECYFTHSINLGNARLGRASFEGCEFESAPADVKIALDRYSEQGSESNRTNTGSLLRVMKVAQGVYAPGAAFDGGIDLTGVTAQRLDFGSARITNIIDLARARISLPHFSQMNGFEMFNDNRDYTAVNLAGSSAQLLRLLETRIKGMLTLTEARLERFYAFGSSIDAHGRYRGNRDIAINAKALHVNSDVTIAHLYPQHSRGRTVKPRTEIVGRLFFDSAKIGGNFEMHGVKITLGLSEKFRDEIKRRGASTFHERQATRALSLRNSTIGGWLKLSRHEPILDDDDQPSSREDKFECDGEIDLRSLVVGDDLRFEGCVVSNRARTTAIDLREAKIEGTLLFKEFDIACDGIIDLRDTYVKVYRDDFNYTGGVKPLINRAWNDFVWYPVGNALAFCVSCVLAIVTVGLFPLTKSSMRSSNEKQKTWPRELKFLLSGFTYDSFPIRGSQGRKDNSDSSSVAISREARVRWLRHQPSSRITDRFQPQPWTQCAKVLRQMGYYRQAHIIEIKREKEALRSENISILSKIFRWPLILICGHGHEMWRLAVVATAAFLPGLFFNQIAVSTNLMRPTNAEILVDNDYREAEYSPPDYSALRAFPFTIKRLLAPPPMASSTEWAPCSGQQIQRAVTEGFVGACVPSACSIAHASVDLDASVVREHDHDGRRFAMCRKLPTLVVVNTRKLVPETERSTALKCEGGRSLRDCFVDAFEVKSPSSVKYAYRAEDKDEYDSQSKGLSEFDMRGGVYAEIFEAAKDDDFLFWTIADVASFMKSFQVPGANWSVPNFDANEFLLNGGLSRWNGGLAITGWGILAIFGVFAVGLLKRKE